mgnify:CR=1 FL=1
MKLGFVWNCNRVIRVIMNGFTCKGIKHSNGKSLKGRGFTGKSATHRYKWVIFQCYDWELEGLKVIKNWEFFEKWLQQRTHQQIARLPPLPDINNPSPFGGFLKYLNPQSSSILFWDLPWNKPSILGVSPVFLWNHLCSPNFYQVKSTINSHQLGFK